MTPQPFETLDARYVTLPVDNIDTDQIIPARFLKGTTRTGLGRGLFADWRHDETGAARPEFVLNGPEAEDAEVLVAGHNFGCGSSREHAAWALLEEGFRAVVSTAIADIFKANALKNGLLPVEVSAGMLEELVRQPHGRIVIELASQQIFTPKGRCEEFPIEPFAKRCLLEGVDQLGFLLGHETVIADYERARSAQEQLGPTPLSAPDGSR